MKRWVLNLFYALCYWLGITALFNYLNRHETRILTYHNILPDALFDGTPHLLVSHGESEFLAHLDILERHYRIGTDIDAPGQCVISFDDGYANNLRAAELLERRGHRGVFFVPAGPLRDGRTLVIDRVLAWFSYAPPGTYRVLGRPVALRSEARLDAFLTVFDALCDDIDAWPAVEAQLNAAFPFASLDMPPGMAEARFRPMDGQELARLRKAGHIVACHSWNHRPLSRLDDAALAEEFARCRESAAIYNRPWFSYPYGTEREVDGRTMRQCAAAGFERGLVNTTVDKFPGADPNFAVPRIVLEGTNRHVLLARLSGFDRFVRRFLGKG
jgi:peptidoglycan/xylan/chitin deacetylase (PgdA/CDA1 family)